MHNLNFFYGNQGGPGPTPSAGRFYFLQNRKMEWFWCFALLIVAFHV